MARKANVNYFETRGGYYTQLAGKQRRLATGPKDEPDGPTYTAALAKFRQLKEQEEPAPLSIGCNVGFVLARFILHLEAHRSPGTVAIRRPAFRDFAQRFGERPVSSLTHAQVWEYIHGRQQRDQGAAGPARHSGGTGATRNLLQGLQAAFNWARKPGVGLIPFNPLAGIETPGRRRRTRDVLISAEEHARVLETADPRLRDLAVCLQATGARPGELCNARAADYDPADGALTLRGDATRQQGHFRHKTAAVQDRVILFDGESRRVMDRLAAAHPTGPLFFNRHGRPFTVKSLHDTFRRLRGPTGKANLTPYCYRHAFATAWLMRGGSIDQLASLLGDTAAVIRQSYAHCTGDNAGLRAALEAFRAAPEFPATSGPRLRIHG